MGGDNLFKVHRRQRHVDCIEKENDFGELVSARVVVPHYGRAYPIYSRLENHILQDTRG